MERDTYSYNGHAVYWDVQGDTSNGVFYSVGCELCGATSMEGYVFDDEHTLWTVLLYHIIQLGECDGDIDEMRETIDKEIMPTYLGRIFDDGTEAEMRRELDSHGYEVPIR